VRCDQGSVSLASVPPAASWPGASFPPRGPWGRFPRLQGTIRRSDSLPPISPRFVSFARPISRSHPRFDPEAAGCTGHGPGVGHPVPPAGNFREDGRASQVPGEPQGERALFSDPGGTTTPGHRGVVTRPSVVWTTSAPTMMSISGLNGTARSLAVYASPRRLPGRHARLASGRWPSSAGRGSIPRRVPSRSFRDTIASSAPKLSWRTHTAGLWRRRYLQRGLAGLQDAPRSGRPRSFSPLPTA
jgi:hypothetical protein